MKRTWTPLGRLWKNNSKGRQGFCVSKNKSYKKCRQGLRRGSRKIIAGATDGVAENGAASRAAAGIATRAGKGSAVTEGAGSAIGTRSAW